MLDPVYFSLHLSDYFLLYVLKTRLSESRNEFFSQYFKSLVKSKRNILSSSYIFKILKIWKKLSLTWNWWHVGNLQLDRKCSWLQKEAHWLQPGRPAVSVAPGPDAGHVTHHQTLLPARLTLDKSRTWRKHTGWSPTPQGGKKSGCSGYSAKRQKARNSGTIASLA